ncbi:CCAAT-binding factor [Dillenia turbinata]|uniref:CCAAT-binding factor n=1 Tax=Dillenia turbinata TaxID=194707 RepID=A0AAN8UQS8_9MAGN
MDSKPNNKKSGDNNSQDIKAIKSEVASFASQLGLSSSSLPTSGFDVSDFRKSGPLKSRRQAQPKPNSSNNKNEKQKQQQPPPKPTKKPFPTIDQSKQNNKFKNLPRLPLMRASSLASTRAWRSGRIWLRRRRNWARLLAQYTHDYESSKGQSGDIKMVVATRHSGTAADKVSAFSVLVASSHGVILDRACSYVCNSKMLIRLLLISLLPDRKLQNLIQRPVNKLPESKGWLFSSTYLVLGGILIYALLSSKSEQERRLLSALVNKLGDPDNKTASTALFLLTNLLSDHPNMTVLSGAPEGSKMDKDNKKADKRASGSPKDGKGRSPTEPHVEMDSRLLKALLTGVNRAFLFVSSDEANDIIEVQTPMLYQLVHSQNFNVGVQALMLSDKISLNNQIASGRFYRALYSKLLLPAAMNSSKEEMFIALLRRAMTNDINLRRVAASQTLTAGYTPTAASIYLTVVFFSLKSSRQGLPYGTGCCRVSQLMRRQHFEDILEDTEDQAQAQPEAEKPKNLVEVDHHRDNSDDDDDGDSEEDKSESSNSEDGASDREDFLMGEATRDLEESKPLSHDNCNQPVSPTSKSTPRGNNPRHREPSYWYHSFYAIFFDRVSWWELMVLASHVHPSVAAMARTLLSGANIFDMNKHLIGEELLSLAEEDVPLEDLVFHKFYAHKMPSAKKLKKKRKKKAGDDETEEYDYDDLDKTADEDDDDLAGNVSDTEMEIPFDVAEGEDDDEPVFDNDNDPSDDDGDIEIEADDDSEEDNEGNGDFKFHHQRKRKAHLLVHPLLQVLKIMNIC